eukprot:m.293094 g.293094  ORF g.293094 m.293094 type:complete len:300 (+) comp18498_c0_seq1:137-1036(+)
MKSYDVFLSFCTSPGSQTRSKVRAIANELCTLKILPFFDEFSIPEGDDIDIAIKHGLETSGLMFYFVTGATSTADGEWQRREKWLAEKKGLTIKAYDCIDEWPNIETLGRQCQTHGSGLGLERPCHSPVLRYSSTAPRSYQELVNLPQEVPAIVVFREGSTSFQTDLKTLMLKQQDVGGCKPFYPCRQDGFWHLHFDLMVLKPSAVTATAKQAQRMVAQIEEPTSPTPPTKRIFVLTNYDSMDAVYEGGLSNMKRELRKHAKCKFFVPFRGECQQEFLKRIVIWFQRVACRQEDSARAS